MSGIFLCFFFLFSLSFAQAEPIWLSSRTAAFPESEFISAVGSGKSEQEAKNDALSSLAVYFGVSVDVKKSSKFSASESKGSVSKSKFSSSKTEIQATNILPAVQFSEIFESDGNFRVCAYIRRASAADEFSARAENALSKAAFLVMSAESESDAIAVFKSAKSALEFCKDAENAAKGLSVLDFDKSSAIFKRMRQTKSSAEKIASESRKKCVFAVMSDGDDGTAESAVREIAEKEGFSCGEDGSYTIFISLSFQESENRIGVFVRPSIEVSLFDAEGNAVASYSKMLAKFGHRTIDAAYSKARAEIAKDLRENIARGIFE